jgi:glycosyltransferase involved in cell wall biosynthesis
MKMTSASIVLAGAPLVGAAGNPVSTEVLLAALSNLGEVALLTHRHRLWPSFERLNGGGRPEIRLGAQPLSVHGEAMLAGVLHRHRLATAQAAWAVNSRYAGALMAANVRYAVWEATPIRDELGATDVASIRRAGTGSGSGLLLHRVLLPLDERIEGLIYKRAFGVYAMSPYTRERILARHDIDPSRIEVLPHPPAPTFLAALEGQRRVVERAPRRPPTDDARLLFVGRGDDPRKGFKLLLDAYRLLRAAQTRVTLTVVGPHARAWRESLGIDPAEGIEFRGRVSTDDLAAAYLAHDLLIVPSRQEGFGIVVAESLHAGLPVVATRCGGPEAMISESEAGVLVPHSPDRIAAAVLELLNDPARRERLARAAVAYARRALSFEAFSDRVARITQLLLPTVANVSAPA